jgi:Ca2+-binding RTX toxin-like protein
MRRTALVVVTMASALLLASGVALAATINCVVGVTCLGTEGDDTIIGTDQSDPFMFGHDGNDLLRGRDGADRLEGGMGNDTLNGGRGRDEYQFGAFFVGEDWGSDTISIEDTGIGRLDFSSWSKSGVTVNLRPSGGNEVVAGTNTVNFPQTVVIEEVLGGRASDSVSGNGVDNFLIGFLGDDSMNGSGGNDVVLGGEGNDGLTGGTGRDGIGGEDGNDIIVALDGEADRIDCGGGTDTVYFDPSLDTLVGDNCERKRTILPPPPTP